MRCRAGQSRILFPLEKKIDSEPIFLCLEVHDLALSKYVAAREKDREFTRELARRQMTDKKILLKRLATTGLDAALSRAVRRRVERDFAPAGG